MYHLGYSIDFSFATSFRSQTEIVSTGFRLLPVNWILDNYIAILTNTSTAPIMQWLWNSLFIAVTHTVLVVIVVSVTAYGYGRTRFKYRDRIFYLLMGISMFPGVVNLIPSYKIIETFGWVNSSLAMIVPGLAGMGNIFLVRQFMKEFLLSLMNRREWTVQMSLQFFRDYRSVDQTCSDRCRTLFFHWLLE